ncbi:zinc ABC transporter ATP-binding protein ZnuC [Zooshikella marina]|uniref:zinc ABC transporter ATP-binding protein ZnuC n=1 Tax=Zooshikella ganghwensis TaxID=202772 RepID=UPI0003F9577A|nr:zinc ABC transporter ATP-binding protein ZnuC [Zooshikella ganghwensis]MBU2709003.1 zinc ABC transporter ATP-binding protein ZnuC [Zooshikella ganghwensis]
MSVPLLQLTDINVCYADQPILQNVTLSISEKEIVTLIGPNGAGKTTLVRVVLGLLNPTSGTRQMRDGVTIGYMPQKVSVEPTLPLSVKHFLRLAKKEKATDISKVLQQVGIAHLVNQPVYGLSGGEMQRVLLARALLQKPNLLVLDEPVQGVDITGQRELYKLIAALRSELGCGVLMVSHDLHLVMAATDKVVCLNKHVCCSGHPEHVTNDPAYIALFGEQESEFAVYAHHHDHTHSTDGAVIHND